MRKLTPTLTQSGLLAVLLQRQRYKIRQLAWRRAQRNQMRAALWSTLTWPWRALTAPDARPPFAPSFRRNRPAPHLNVLPTPIAMSHQIHTYRTPATDSRRSADTTSRMGQVRWRMSYVRFLRVAPNGDARHFNAKRIQRYAKYMTVDTSTLVVQLVLLAAIVLAPWFYSKQAR
jgi:hypothetical protein